MYRDKQLTKNTDMKLWRRSERERESDIKRMKKRKKTGTTREKDTVCEAAKT